MLQAIDTPPTPTVLPENAFWGRIAHQRFDLVRLVLVVDDSATRDATVERWLKLFQHGQIMMLDSTHKDPYLHPRVRVTRADATHLEHLKKFRAWVGPQVDFVIDAREANPAAQQALLPQLFFLVKARGHYIIEDAHAPDAPAHSLPTDDMLHTVRQALVWGEGKFPKVDMVNADNLFAEMSSVDLYTTSHRPGPLGMIQRRADSLRALDPASAALADQAQAKGPLEALRGGALPVPRAVAWDQVDRTLVRFSHALLRMFGGAQVPTLEAPLRATPSLVLGCITEGNGVRLYMRTAENNGPKLYVEQLSPAHRVQALETVPDLMELAVYHLRVRESQMLHIVQGVNEAIDRLGAYCPGAPQGDR